MHASNMLVTSSLLRLSQRLLRAFPRHIMKTLYIAQTTIILVFSFPSLCKRLKKYGVLKPQSNFPNVMLHVLGFIYPPITHWAWTEEGWLHQLGYVDFSGSGPIHVLGGVCSFCAAVFLGPRLGRFGARREEIVGHSVPVSLH